MHLRMEEVINSASFSLRNPRDSPTKASLARFLLGESRSDFPASSRGICKLSLLCAVQVDVDGVFVAGSEEDIGLACIEEGWDSGGYIPPCEKYRVTMPSSVMSSESTATTGEHASIVVEIKAR
eukprot:4285045-Pyramimonas_sp.AAC.2